MKRIIKLRFHGLMFFHFDDCTKCRVGIHTTAKHHKIIIKVGKETKDGVTGPPRVIPTQIARALKHVWLYVADVNNERALPKETQISLESQDDEPFEKVMDITECYEYRDPLQPKWDDVLTPSLHITAGRFFAKTVTQDCMLVNEDAIANLFFAIFQPTDCKLGARFDRTKDEYGKGEPKTLAEIIGVDITVEDNQRLVLAVGDENGPEHVLFSIEPTDDLAILIANLPPRSSLLPKDFNHEDRDDGQDDREEGPRHPPDDGDIEKQIRGRLRHTFHFLHYYDAFDNKPTHKSVLLGKTDNLDDKPGTRGVRPDPPCKGIRGNLPFINQSAPPDSEAKRSE
jgi:hypothetical protein